MAKKEEEKRLLKRSSDFLKTAEYQIDNGFYDLATFSLQQALELFLKSKVRAQGSDYPKTHSLRELLDILSKIADEDKKAAVKEASKKYLLELGLLEDAYITSRYITREFTKDEAERLAQSVKEIMQIVK